MQRWKESDRTVFDENDPAHDEGFDKLVRKIGWRLVFYGVAAMIPLAALAVMIGLARLADQIPLPGERPEAIAADPNVPPVQVH